MDIQIPYYKNYEELIKSHDMIIESLGELSNVQERRIDSKRTKDDLEMLKLLAWSITLILEQDVSILRDLEKEDREYVDAFNQKLKEI